MPGATGRTRRRTLLAAGAAVPLAGPLAACTSGTEVTGRLRIATGNPGAVFERYGAALAAEVASARPGVDADTLFSAGSQENLDALGDGRADVAFCLGDTAGDRAGAATGPLPFLALARLYDSFLQVVTRADSSITSLADLAGRRLGAGQPGSGTRTTLLRSLEAGGVQAGELVDTSLAESASGLADGTLDALGFVSGFPVPALVELGEAVPLRAVDLSGVVPELVRRWGAQYVAGPLTATPYGLPDAVDTVSVKTYLVCRRDLDDDLARAVVEVVFDGQDAIARRVPDVRQPTVSAGMFTSPVPLHPASTAWFRERDAQGG